MIRLTAKMYASQTTRTPAVAENSVTRVAIYYVIYAQKLCPVTYAKVVKTDIETFLNINIYYIFSTWKSRGFLAFKVNVVKKYFI